jgi:hypothetical protein
VKNTYEIWSQKISMELEKSIFEATIIKFNNTFGFAIRKGIVEKADDAIKMRYLHAQITIRRIFLNTMNVFPYDILNVIAQTMLKIGF